MSERLSERMRAESGDGSLLRMWANEVANLEASLAAVEISRDQFYAQSKADRAELLKVLADQARIRLEALEEAANACKTTDEGDDCNAGCHDADAAAIRALARQQAGETTKGDR